MKKGELSLKTLAFIILIVMGFVISGAVYLSFNFTETTSKETCHASVIARSLPQVITEVDIKDFIPLNCQTQKYCITAGISGGSCKEEFMDVGKIEKVKIDSKGDIEKVITEQMFDCWTMMGEGKVSVYSEGWEEKYGVGEITSSCVICSRIAFDEKGLMKNSDISLQDLKEVNPVDYMLAHKIPGKEISYYDYLGGMASSNQIEINENILFGEENKNVLNSEEGNPDLEGDPYSELAVVFMQITAPNYGKSALDIGKKVLQYGGGTAMIAPKLTYAAGSKVAGACVSSGPGIAVCLGILALAGIYQQGSVAYNRGIAAEYCGDLSAGEKDGGRNGCSAVRVVNYDISQIKQYCEVIESKG